MVCVRTGWARGGAVGMQRFADTCLLGKQSPGCWRPTHWLFAPVAAILLIDAPMAACRFMHSFVRSILLLQRLTMCCWRLHARRGCCCRCWQRRAGPFPDEGSPTGCCGPLQLGGHCESLWPCQTDTRRLAVLAGVFLHSGHHLPRPCKLGARTTLPAIATAT